MTAASILTPLSTVHSPSPLPVSTTETSLGNPSGSIVCSVEKCGATFSGKWAGNSYSRHKRQHENELKFTCDECDKSFGRKDNRRKHMFDIHKRKRDGDLSECITES